MQDARRRKFPLQLTPPSKDRFYQGSQGDHFPRAKPTHRLFMYTYTLNFPPTRNVKGGQATFKQQRRPSIQDNPRGLVQDKLPTSQTESFHPREQQIVRDFTRQAAASRFPKVLRTPRGQSNLYFQHSQSRPTQGNLHPRRGERRKMCQRDQDQRLTYHREVSPGPKKASRAKNGQGISIRLPSQLRQAIKATFHPHPLRRTNGHL